MFDRFFNCCNDLAITPSVCCLNPLIETVWVEKTTKADKVRKTNAQV